MPELVDYAAARRIMIALESHGGLTGPAERTCATIARVDSAWCG